MAAREEFRSDRRPVANRGQRSRRCRGAAGNSEGSGQRTSPHSGRNGEAARCVERAEERDKGLPPYFAINGTLDKCMGSFTKRSFLTHEVKSHAGKARVQPNRASEPLLRADPGSRSNAD